MDVDQAIGQAGLLLFGILIFKAYAYDNAPMRVKQHMPKELFFSSPMTDC